MHGHATHFGGLPVAEPNRLPQAAAGRADTARGDQPPHALPRARDAAWALRVLSGGSFTHLAHLNLRHHYIGPTWQQRLRDEPSGVRSDLDDEEPDDCGDGEIRRYVEVAE
ncbi:hypothetical protein GTZ85_32870 [Streptomyces sp. SID5474]|nr:hypothetical protein [Streptomyces sp. SID5474]